MFSQLTEFTAPRRAFGAALLAAAALGLAGCAALMPKTPEQVVRERAEQRWAALIDGDFDKAWTYTQPGYRAVVKQRDYHKRFGGAGQWMGVQIHDVTCEAERCKVRIRLTTKVMIPSFMGKEVSGYMDESWVRDEGQWWYYQSL
ncbi:MAG: hypothetical protein FWG56_00500 [Desulfovibrionaceae bacterium]|nr:hypothetical protein [Desulfovibrionaceae bacterium]